MARAFKAGAFGNYLERHIRVAKYDASGFETNFLPKFANR
jgi:hypothetical protein